MNEAQRQFYLKQCGITLWYSHTPLAGAAPSIEFEFPSGFAEDESESSTSSEPLVERNTRSGADPILQRKRTPKPSRERVIPADQKSTLDKVIAEAMPIKVPAKPEPAASTIEVSEAAPGIAVPAKLSVDLRIAVTKDLVVIAQLGGDLPTDVQEKLLMQISGALGRPTSADGLMKLSWPAFSNRSVPGNDDAGFSALWRHMLSPLASRTWLGLGAEVGELLAVPVQAGSGPRLAFAHDLGALATSGILKRQLWDLIQGAVAPEQRSE